MCWDEVKFAQVQNSYIGKTLDVCSSSGIKVSKIQIYPVGHLRIDEVYMWSKTFYKNNW